MNGTPYFLAQRRVTLRYKQTNRRNVKLLSTLRSVNIILVILLNTIFIIYFVSSHGAYFLKSIHRASQMFEYTRLNF